MLCDDANDNTTYSGLNLAYHIKTLLQSIGLGNVWYKQRANNVNFQNIKQRILYIFKQSWYSNINNSSRPSHYSLHKQEFKIETYLICNIDKKYQSVLSKSDYIQITFQSQPADIPM